MFNFDQSLVSVLNTRSDTTSKYFVVYFPKIKVGLFVVTMEKVSRERVNSHTIN
jgi:hypothetical protein